MLVDALLLGIPRVAARTVNVDLHAPLTIDAEFLHAMRRRWLAHAVDDKHAAGTLTLFRRLVITRHPVEPLVPRIWSLRQNVTVYDAA